MSLKLTNRLDQIENDIRLMLLLQKCGNIKRAGLPTSITESNSVTSNLLGKCASRNERAETQSLPEQPSSSKPSKELHRPISNFFNAPPKPYCGCETVISDFKDKTLTYPEDMLEDKLYSKNSYFSSTLELEYEQVRRRRLEDEVNQLKSQLSSMVHSKDIAITMTKQLKKKYEKTKSALEETNSKLVDITKEKDFLCKCLEREKNNSPKTNVKAVVPKQADVTLAKSAGRCLETIQERDEQMKSLQESVELLTKELEESNKENQIAITEKERLEQKLKKQKEKTKKLSEVNQKLSHSLKSKHESLMALKNKSNKYQKEVEHYKSNFNKSQIELVRLKQDLQNERIKSSSDRNKILEDVAEKLRKANDKERWASETICALNQKIQDIEDQPNKHTQKEIDILKAEIANLQAKLNQLLYKLKKYEEEDARSLKMKPQIHVPPHVIQIRTDELMRRIEDQKCKIEELESLRQQQDVVLKSQNEQLVSKEEQIRLQERQNEIVREKCLQLDKQLEVMSAALDAKENAESDGDKIKELQRKVEDLKSSLEIEKRKVSEQEKQIRERTDELEAMKKSAAALEMSKDKLEMTIRELARGKEAAKIVADGLEKLNLKKEKLEDMMYDLEGACREVLGEKDHYVKICDDLEKQLSAERRLRMLERHTLIEERNKAFEVARLAAMTLIETVDDYEVLTKSQLKAQHSITDIIKTKQQKRRPGCPPVPSLKSRDEQSPYIDVRPNEDTTDTSPKSSINNALDSEFVEDPSSCDGGLDTDVRCESYHTCSGNSVPESEVRMGMQIPITTISPYTIQSALISTTPYGCWVRNCGYTGNQTLCGISNASPLPCSNSTGCRCQYGTSHSTQAKSPKIHAPIRVTSKKSTCVCPRKKRTR